jgi:hypothetical protein
VSVPLGSDTAARRQARTEEVKSTRMAIVIHL